MTYPTMTKMKIPMESIGSSYFLNQVELWNIALVSMTKNVQFLMKLSVAC